MLPSLNTSMVITEKVLDKAYRLALKRFLQSPAPRDLKQVAKRVVPNFIISNKPRAGYHGLAWACTSKSHDKVFKKYPPSNLTPVLINGRFFYCFVEVNIGLNKVPSREFINNLVSHEWAHLVDITVNGFVERNYSIGSDLIDHYYFWQLLHRWSGGDGEEFII